MRNEKTSSGYCIFISKNGNPIPSEIKQKVFYKHFTTKAEGRAPGLSIVMKLVEAHGWQVSLIDDPVITFRICISTDTVLNFSK